MKKALQSRYHTVKKRLGFKRHAPAITNQKRIVIYVHHLLTFDASWVILADHSKVEQITLHGDLTTLTPIAQQYEIHVIIPGQDVLLTQAELPKLTRERLLQALPYAVEDKLIDEIGNLHFAIGKYSTHGTPVAIISKSTMDTCLQELKKHGIMPHTMIPATLALPWTEHDWHASCDDTISIIRTDQFSGFACDRTNFQMLLQLQILEKPIKPECIHIENISQTELDLTLEPILINETISTENHFLEKTAILLGTNPYINLLQGLYRPKRKSTQTKKVWKLAGIVAALWLSFTLTSNLISLLILQHAKNISEQEIHAIYHQQFPTATSMVAPRERMESALKKASADANKNYFLTLLGLLSDAKSNSPDIRLYHFDYQENRLNLAVSGKSFDTLDAFTQALNKEGLRVKQQNATTTDTEVKANILISKGDA